MACEDFTLDRAAFLSWIQSEGETNTADIEHTKKAMLIVLQEYVSNKQRTYIMLYFAEQKTVREIGELFGVSASTVSRTIHRGLKRMYRYLRFTAPGFIDAPRSIRYLRRGRRKKQHEQNP